MATALAEPEVVEIHDDGEGPLFEIVDGVRVEKTMSMVAQWSGSQISRLVANYIEDDGPGGFVVTETFIACFDWAPGTKRRPDVAYWHAHQFPDGLPERGEATIAPAWCIEVVSPGDNAEALEEKVAEYFRAGVELVWIVIPATRSVRTERPDGTAHVYRGDQALTADPVLPAFTAPVARLFPKTAATPSASESD